MSSESTNHDPPHFFAPITSPYKKKKIIKNIAGVFKMGLREKSKKQFPANFLAFLKIKSWKLLVVNEVL